MGRRSRVFALPEPVRRVVDQLINSGRYTLDDVLAHLRKLAAEGQVDESQIPSRSAVGRYSKRASDVAARLREAREVAGSVVEQIGVDPTGDVGMLTMQMLHTIAFQTLETMTDAEKAAAPRDLMFLAKAIRDLQGAGKTGYEHRKAIREEARTEAVAQAQKIVETVARKGGLTKEAVDQLKADFLGIRV
jgi:hypothetical protein